MNFNLDISVTATTVLIQGLLSFFSPCVFPLVPLYIGYFSGGAKKVDEDGTIYYPQGRVLLHTIFFVLGISAAFFLLGFGFTALGQFFSDNQYLFARISGIIMIFFGLYQLGLFGHSNILEQERKLPFRLDKMTMGPLPALLLGFTFSFAWTPCVGPTLSIVLLLAGSVGNAARGLGLIFIYTLGFVLPFLAVGLFTRPVFLNFWATWCPPCRSEMPEIQNLYEEYGYNEGDLVVLGVAAPGVGQEGDLDSVKEFLSKNGYTFPVAMDSLGVFTSIYSIRAYPTTFMISEDGSVYGYVEGALTEDLMHSIVKQTMEAD